MIEQLFSVIEYTSFFAVRHNPTGEEFNMGDGVDAIADEEGETLIPGSAGFVETWQEILNSDPSETLAAYFPDKRMNAYFIVLDEAPIKGHPTPTYVLSFGDPQTAIGTHQARAHTIKALVAKVPVGEPVYRTYLRRTDGRTGFKELKR